MKATTNKTSFIKATTPHFVLSSSPAIPCNDDSRLRMQVAGIMNVFDLLKDMETADDRDRSCR